MADVKKQEKAGLSVWQIIRWLMLGVAAVAVFLMLKKPSAVVQPMTSTAARERSNEVQTKLAELETAHQRGEAGEARFSSDEINGTLQAQAEPASNPGDPPQQATREQKAGVAEEPAAEITATRVSFEGDEATGQFVVHAPGGKDIYLTISGKIKAVNGYASFEFTEGKIGDMPVPVALLNARLRAKLEEPETRAKLKLPDFVGEIRVENGQLVMTDR